MGASPSRLAREGTGDGHVETVEEEIILVEEAEEETPHNPLAFGGACFFLPKPAMSIRPPILTASSCDTFLIDAEGIDAIDAIDDMVDEDEHDVNEEETSLVAAPQSREESLRTFRSEGDDSMSSMFELRKPRSSQTTRPPRVLDIYQTDSTVVVPPHVEEKDQSHTLPSDAQTKPQIPFRTCTRKRCSSCSQRKQSRDDDSRQRIRHSYSSRSLASTLTCTSAPSSKESSASLPGSETPSLESPQQCFSAATDQPAKANQHRRQPSDDLMGLWIPLAAQGELEDDDPNCPAPSTLEWMPKAKSERDYASWNTDDNHTPTRERAHSEDWVPQPKPRLPLPRTQSTRRSSTNTTPTHKRAVSLVEPPSSEAPIRTRTRSEDVVDIPPDMAARLPPEPLIREATPVTDSPKRNAPYHRMRSRSEDIIDVPVSSSPRHVKKRQYHRQRSRSEDVIDWPANTSPPADSYKQKKYHRQRSRSEDIIDIRDVWSDKAKRDSKHARKRGHSQDIVEEEQRDSELPPQFPVDAGIDAPSKLTLPLTDNGPPPLNPEEQSPAHKKGILPASPTSVLEVHDALPLSSNHSVTSNASSVPPMQAQSPYYAWAVQEFRRAVDVFRQGRQPKDNDSSALDSHATESNVMARVAMHHNIAWLHYQHSRYDAAFCVINHALELLQRSQQKSTPSGQTSACLTLTELLDFISPSVSPILADLLLTKARICLSMGSEEGSGQNHQLSNHCNNSIQQAKRLAKTAISLVQPLMNGPGIDSAASMELNLLFAKGLVVLGQTYSETNKRDVAMKTYHQVLSVLRYLLDQDNPNNLLLAETLLLMGNLHLAEGLLDLAKDSYSEALKIYRCHPVLQQQLTGTADRHHQCSALDMATTLTNLGWIHLMENDIVWAHQATMEALVTLQHAFVGAAVNHRNLASIQFQLGMIVSRQGQPKQALRVWKTTLEHQRAVLKDSHVDIAVSLEAIGSTYHQLERWDKAKGFLEGALDRFRDNSRSELDVARVQSRLSLVYIRLENYKKAHRSLGRAKKILRCHGLPLDDLGHQAQDTLLQHKESRRGLPPPCAT